MSPAGVHSALRVPADFQVVAFVRCAFACLLAREGWPAEGAGRVLLASTEGLANAIEHGSPEGGRIDIELSVTLERTGLRVVDEGRAGVPVPVYPATPPPVTSPRGRGLIIIRRLADDFELTADGDGTRLEVGFLRSVAEEAEARVSGDLRAA
jgi:anti-sigma regulatory factor (Ser/Thr protein kinase)